MNIHTAQLHLGDLMGGTSHMRGVEFGAYMLLVVACYQSSDHRIPDDDSRLAMMARVSLKTWARIRPTVMHKFIHKLEGGESYFVHDRVLKEVDKYLVRSSKNKDNALKRWNSEMQIASVSQCDRNAIHNPIPNKEIINTSSSSTGAANGVVKNKRGESEAGYNIMHHLSERGLQAAKDAAPGWDIYNLANAYNGGIGRRGLPKYPDRAFPEWCARYVKDKTP